MRRGRFRLAAVPQKWTRRPHRLETWNSAQSHDWMFPWIWSAPCCWRSAASGSERRLKMVCQAEQGQQRLNWWSITALSNPDGRCWRFHRRLPDVFFGKLLDVYFTITSRRRYEYWRWSYALAFRRAWSISESWRAPQEETWELKAPKKYAGCGRKLPHLTYNGLLLSKRPLPPITRNIFLFIRILKKIYILLMKYKVLAKWRWGILLNTKI